MTDLDDLLADIEAATGPPGETQPAAEPVTEPPPPAVVPPTVTPPSTAASAAPPAPPADDGFFSAPRPPQPPDPDLVGTPPGGDPPATAPRGRFAPSEPVKVTRRGKGTGLGGIAVFTGVVCLLLSWFMPGFVFVVAITLGGTFFLGGWTFRHAVNYDTPGKTTGAIALVLGALSLVAFVIGLQRERDQMTQVSGGGIFGAMAAADAESEVRSLDLPGTGSASIVLDGQQITVPLDACGLADPAIGVAAAGRGVTDTLGREVSVTFLRSTLGDGGDTVVISLGTNGYSAHGDAVFQIDGGTLRTSAEFRRLFGSGRVDVELVATCNA